MTASHRRGPGGGPRRGVGRTRRGARGFSLVELLVSLAIGVMVIGALLAAWMAVQQTSRHADALAQMSEDGSAALQVLRQHVAMAGFHSVAPAGAPARPALFGCDGGGGFTGGTGAAIGDLGGCAGGAGGPDWLAVAYEVQVDAAAGGRSLGNGVLGSGATPMDCVGNAVARSGGAFVVDSHFYVQRPSGGTRTALYCRQGGAGSSVTGQPVAENVVDFQVRYLLAAEGGGGGGGGNGGASARGPQQAASGPRQAAWFSDAPAATPGPGNRFDDVLAVRLCVEITSATPVADRGTPQPYLDCRDTSVQATDGYLHRAFTTTVTLENRLRP